MKFRFSFLYLYGFFMSFAIAGAITIEFATKTSIESLIELIAFPLVGIGNFIAYLECEKMIKNSTNKSGSNESHFFL